MGKKNDDEFRRMTGLTILQFNELLSSLPELVSSTKTKNASVALYVFLTKLRTGRSNEDIANELSLTAATVARKLKQAREALMDEFTFQHVNNARDHADLVQHTTTMSGKLFCDDVTDRALVICDGTYIYCNKSRNYEFQKKTYTDQKKRNFLKVMMCVASDGYIISALGPYPAVDNDAKILRSIFENTDAFQDFCPGDIFMLDRGFRDCVDFVKNKGFEVRMPNLIQKSQNKHQLSTEEANQSRFVTATRFVVETRNGHMKQIWKIFNKDWNPQAIPHLMDDFMIGAALLNKFFTTFEPNQGFAVEIADRMIALKNKPNKLSKIVQSASFQRAMKHFEEFEAVDELPVLSERDLLFISLGKYQIKQAASYCQEHVKRHSSQFQLFRYPESKQREFIEQFESEENKLILVFARILSRHRSQKKYDAYVLIDINGLGANSVLEYCCECYVGLRTVGCCSHVMTIIWYSLFTKKANFMRPAHFLNNFFCPELNHGEDEDGIES